MSTCEFTLLMWLLLHEQIVINHLFYLHTLPSKEIRFHLYEKENSQTTSILRQMSSEAETNDSEISFSEKTLLSPIQYRKYLGR